MLEVKNLVKVYKPKKGKEVRALNGVSIKFPEKGLVFILGKSGCGKSTLLNMLGGLDRVDSGEIIIKGKSSKDFTQADFDSYRNTYLGFIFQEYNILNEFTVGANVGLALELQGRKATKEAINEILQQVEMEEYASRKPMQLSGGQKQRIAIARALVKNPEIILADEPTGALDSKTGIQVFDTLKALSKEKLVIVVSHDREFAESYGDRVIELKDGEVISDIEKYVAESDKKNESIAVIDDKIIQIEKGYELTAADVKMINDYLKRNQAIISIDEMSNRDLKKFARIDDAGNKECFKDTDEAEIVYEKQQKFRLIRSRLPFKDSFKIGASGLKAKPFRLFVSILLSFVAFCLFGLADTINAYNKYTATYNSLVDSQVENISFAKNVKVQQEGQSWYMQSTQKMSDDDLAKLKQKTGLDYIAVQSPTDSISFTNNTYKSFDSWRSMYASSANGFIEIDDSFITSTGFTYAGKIPTANDEIMITEYEFQTFKKYGYQMEGSKSKIIYEGGDEVFNSFESFLAIKPVLNVSTYPKEIKYKIVGILDTKFNYDHFKSLSNDENSSSGVMDYLLIQELDSTAQYGYHGQIFVKKGFVDANYASADTIGHPIGYSSGVSGISLYFEPTSTDSYGGINANKVLSKQDLDSASISYKILYTDGTTSIKDTDFLMDIKTYKQMLWQAYYNKVSSNEDDWVDAPEWLKSGYSYTKKEELMDASLQLMIAKAEAAGYQYGWWEYDSATDTYSWTPYDNQADWKATNTDSTKKENIKWHLYGTYYSDSKDPHDYPTWATDADNNYIKNNIDQYFYDQANKLLYTTAMSEITEISSLIDNSYYRSYSNNYSGAYDQYHTVEGKIAGLFYMPSDSSSGGGSESAVVVSDSIYQDVEAAAGGKYSFAIAPMDISKLKSVIKWAYDNIETNGNKEITYELKAGPMELLGTVNSLLEDLASVFLYIGLGLAVFAGLMMMNYIATTISYKKREIGILRAVGARSVDVFGIFLNESLIIAVINFVLAAGATFGVVMYLNNMLRTKYNITLTLLDFGIRQIGLILLIAVGVAAISSALPVFNISRKKPIDAIRSE